MFAIPKESSVMNVEELTKLTFEELRIIKNKNFVFFNLLNLLNLLVFYHSLFSEKWLLLFFSFGIFIAGLALYDNYRISSDLLARKNQSDRI